MARSTREREAEPAKRRWPFWLIFIGVALVAGAYILGGSDERPRGVSVALPPASVTPIAPIAQAAAPGSVAAWLKNAVLAPDAAGKARIAIVIDDLGLDRARSTRAASLPGPLTLSFLAYAGNLPQQTEAARHAGHELLVHVPMEPVNAAISTIAAGEQAPLTPDEIQRRLRWDLDRFPGYVGIDDPMGGKSPADAAAMRATMAELKSRGLIFLDARANPDAAMPQVAREAGVPYVARDTFLDSETAPASDIDERLSGLERIALQRFTAIAIVHPHDATLAALARWLPTLPKKGIVLVPLSDIVRARVNAS
ncbi:MAG TPA: divergent polysaccharide deacetylase family protein [Stellaceae bacterium]|jgi:polysaccharide deacetylase 2 family uncharacterized protein YibQ|nr:divergent polysaccharide deacetylase family protein [Stellaceae bacterium]